MMPTQNIERVSRALLTYGRLTPYHSIAMVRSYEAAKPHTKTGNHWSSTEYNGNNSWNVNFNNGNSNNNNNKYNTNVVRPAVAHVTEDWTRLRETLTEAYYDCKRGKNASKQCLDYVLSANEDLDLLTTELLERTYQPTTSTCFLVKYPKLREVFAAAFRDRVIHHWICLRMNPLFEKRNINQNNVTHNCRVGFGTKTAVEAVYNGIRRISCNYNKPAWIFKGDLVGFFMSLPKRRMCNKLLRHAKLYYHGDHKDLLLWLIKVVVMHHPEKNCMFNSKPEDWKGLAPNKSLFRCAEGKGAPIGNLTTQLFANFYMTEFDGWVQKQFKDRGVRFSYTRFVDDFVVVCDDKKVLKSMIEPMARKLEEMDLQMHKDKRYFQPATHGVMFVGTYIHNSRMYLSNRTLGRFAEKLNGIIQYLNLPEDKITIQDLEHIQATLNSYLGFCKGRQTYRIRRKLLKPFITDKCCMKFFRRNYHLTKFTLRPPYRTIVR